MNIQLLVGEKLQFFSQSFQGESMYRDYFHPLVKMNKLKSLVVVNCRIFLDNFEKLPKNLQHLQFSNNYYNYKDYRRPYPFETKGKYLNSKDNSKILRILYDYKRKHPLSLYISHIYYF
jgi:hypothetical protein